MRASGQIVTLLCCAALLLPFAACAQGGPQLYNSSFDTWSRSGVAWRLYPSDAPEELRVWDTANTALSKLGVTSVTPEYKHVAVPGSGKVAARIESRKIAWAFVGGSIYNGKYIRTVSLSGVETRLGAPFAGRPASLSGYYHYLPKAIDHAKAPYENKLGEPDEALVEVLLTDWEEPYVQVSNRDGFINPATNPHVIGYAQLIIKNATDGYVRFTAPFTYRSSATPRHIVFTITSSRFGGTQTGAVGSVLYVDEFAFNY